MDFEGRVHIVTGAGAGSGIGAATARRLAESGARVALVGRTENKLADVAATMPKGASVPLVADFGPFDEVSAESFERIMAINVAGVFQATQAALGALRESKGAVVNVASVSGTGGDWGMAAYNASKGAVVNFTRSLALELGPAGVRVNAVAPSMTRTDMAEGPISNQETMKKLKDRMPLGRPAEPEEIADPILFLLSPLARFVTGAILPVDGGVSASNGQPRMM